jgi:plastocyanin
MTQSRTPFRAVPATLLRLLAPTLMVLMTTAAVRAEDIAIDNFTFNPAQLTVKAGATVTWHNKDDIPHAVASKTRLFKSKALDTDDDFSFTFAEPGTYEYFCSLHPHMTGVVVVEPP